MTIKNSDTRDHLPELGHHRARLDRASQQYALFGTLWGDYLDSRPHQLTTDVDAAGRGELRLIRQKPIPLELALVLGELLYQLRAALDNCLYAVAAIDSGLWPPLGGERLQWPICLTPSEWKQNARRFAGLSADVVGALERIQPYNAECPAWNCLRILHDLARVDRHRTLPVVALFTSQASLRFDRRLVTSVDIQKGIMDRGDVLVRFIYTGVEPIGPQHIDGDFEFEVDLADVTESVGPGGGAPSRPWGSLDSRLRAVIKAVADYTDGLIQIARRAQEPEGDGPEDQLGDMAR